MNYQQKLLLTEQLKSSLESSAPKFADCLKKFHQNGSLGEVLPDVDVLFSAPENTKFHPEGNSGDHTLLTIKELGDNASPQETYAMLLHDIGKAVSYKQKIASGMDVNDKKMTQYFLHPKEGLPLVQKISMQLDVPDNYKEFALLVCEHHMKAYSFSSMKEGSLYDLNKNIPDQYFEQFLTCCLADTLGRKVSSLEKEEIKSKFKQDVKRLKDVRSFMKKHPEVTKDTFSQEYSKAKSVSSMILAKGRDGK